MGVDVVVLGIEELPAAVPARVIMDIKNPENRMNDINSNGHGWSFLHRRHEQGI